MFGASEDLLRLRLSKDMPEIGQNKNNNNERRGSYIQSVRLVTRRRNSGDRMADNVTRDQHSQAFGVIAKALSRNTK